MQVLLNSILGEIDLETGPGLITTDAISDGKPIFAELLLPEKGVTIDEPSFDAQYDEGARDADLVETLQLTLLNQTDADITFQPIAAVMPVQDQIKNVGVVAAMPETEEIEITDAERAQGTVASDLGIVAVRQAPSGDLDVGRSKGPSSQIKSTQFPPGALEVRGGQSSVVADAGSVSTGKDDSPMPVSEEGTDVPYRKADVPEVKTNPILKGEILNLSERNKAGTYERPMLVEAFGGQERMSVPGGTDRIVERDAQSNQRSEVAPTMQAAKPPAPLVSLAAALPENMFRDRIAAIGTDTGMSVGDTDRVAVDTKSVAPRLETTPRPVVNQIVQLAVRANLDGPVEIRLQPEDLGRVKLAMSQFETGVTVHITAERQETLDILRRNIDLLATSLRDEGFENLSFSFGQNGNGAVSDPEEFETGQQDASDDKDGLRADIAPTPSQIKNGRLDLRL